MKNTDKTKEQLLKEIDPLRAKITELEKSKSEYKKTEKTLKESEERYKGIIQSTASCMAVYLPIDNGEDFVFVDFNPMAEKVEQISKDHVIGKKVTQVFPGVAEFGLFKVFQNVWKTGIPEHFPVSVYKDERIHGYRENYIYKLPSGEIVAVYQDHTERKQAENTLRETNARHSAMIENIGDVIAIVGADGMTKYQSPNIEKLFGWKPEDLIGKNGWDLIHSEDIERIQKEFSKIIKKETASLVEYRFKCKDGNYKWIELTAVNRINDPTINGVLLNYHDITEKKQAEEKLLKNKILLESSIESPKDMIILSLDSEYRYMFFNKTHAESMAHVYGTQPQIGDCIFDYMTSKEDIENLKAHYDRAISGEGHISIEGYGEGKVRYYYEIRYNPIYNEKNEIIGITSFAQNITEQKQAEEELKQHRENLEQMVTARTKELEGKNKELDNALKVFVGRELTIKNLQEKIRALGGK